MSPGAADGRDEERRGAAGVPERKEIRDLPVVQPVAAAGGKPRKQDGRHFFFYKVK